MKKVLILCLHRPNRSPSQRFRFEQYLSFLENNGYQFEFSYLLNAEQDKAFYQPGNYGRKLQIVLSAIIKRLSELLHIHRYSLIFVQREAFMLGSAFFEKLMASKVPMIFDFDDSIWMQNVSDANKNLAFLKNAGKTSQIIEKATLVFAGNQYLADYALKYNPNVVIVPTTIDTDVYQYKQKQYTNKQICIGWSGSFSTIQHFTLAVPALIRIKEKYGERVVFKIIGDAKYFCKELNTKGVEWKSETEVEDLSQIDIGIMPLPDDEWAKGKCGLKGLQYMALGIPTLMSPVGVNCEIINNGRNGFLPKSEDDWVNYISQLIENEQLRYQIGYEGKITLHKKYSSDAWKEKYLEYFGKIAVNK